MVEPNGNPTLNTERSGDGVLHVSLAGDWRLANDLPPAAQVVDLVKTSPKPQRITYDTDKVTNWDSGLLTFLIKIHDSCEQNKIQTDADGLPEGVRRLLKLAFEVPEKQTHRGDDRESILAQIGKATIDGYRGTIEMLSFIGESIITLGTFLRGKARYRRSEFIEILKECGADALPIVSLINILVGLILAFVGAVQLEKFGASIYVADLVGIATTREMAAIMTGIIMAGRTGAAFAARLGTMTVNEEIDALETMAISPMEFLVLPRMLALALMMPLLVLYGDLLGILGGLIVGIGMLDLTFTQYIVQTQAAVGLNHFLIGIGKAVLFGVLVALSGCLRGMQCGRSASAVGVAATSAVVTGIVAIIVTDAILAVVTNILGI